MNETYQIFRRMQVAINEATTSSFDYRVQKTCFISHRILSSQFSIKDGIFEVMENE
jgi:hypothetical protein